MFRWSAVTSFAFLLVGSALGQTPVDQPAAERLLAAAKQRLAPDRRTVVFDVEVAVDGPRLVLEGRVHDATLARRLREFFAAETGNELVDRLLALPTVAVGEQTMAIVGVSVANLRSKPGHAEELGTQALLGTPLRVLDVAGGWRYVQTPNDYLCWTDDRVELMTPAQFAAWRRLPMVMVTATFEVVRAERAPEGPAVADVVAGCILALDATKGSWYAVRYADGRTGWLPRTAAAPLDDWLERTNATEQSVVATARRFMGVPYLWGGTSPKGMDCSGFTATVYFLNGELLPRDASQQVRVGTPVEIDAGYRSLRPGDLLFFGRAASSGRPERVTHVGISLGGARFIHSATDVHENSFDPEAADFSSFRRRGLLHARRILGAGEDVGVRRLADLPYYQKP